jgi:hypothetical protein
MSLKKYMLLIFMIAFVSLLNADVYGLSGSFVDESKELEFKNATIEWLAYDITDDEYFAVITGLVANRDLVLYAVFNDRDISTNPDFMDSFRIGAQNMIHRSSGLNGILHNVGLMASYGLLGMDDPSRMFLTMDRQTYYDSDEILLHVDMLGYVIEDNEHGFSIKSYVDGDYSGDYWFEVFSVPVTLDLRDGFSFQAGSLYEFTLDYGYLSGSVSFQVVTSPFQFQLDKPLYYTGETVAVRGTVNDHEHLHPETEVTYDVTLPDGTAIHEGENHIDGTGEFSFTFSTGGPQWDGADGTVSVTVTIEGTSVTRTFDYTPGPGMTNEALYDMITGMQASLDSALSQITLIISQEEDSTEVRNNHDMLLDALNGKITALDDKIDMLDTRMDAMDGQIAALETDG